ncbi:hypothetical protein ACXM5X_32525, partial [Pseudomonas saponiphila]
QAEALGMTNLNGGTLFNAEFGIRHRAAPYRKGQVLHSVFAAACSYLPQIPSDCETTDLERLRKIRIKPL